MILVGYARVSKSDRSQSVVPQRDALRVAAMEEAEGLMYAGPHQQVSGASRHERTLDGTDYVVDN